MPTSKYIAIVILLSIACKAPQKDIRIVYHKDSTIYFKLIGGDTFYRQVPDTVKTKDGNIICNNWFTAGTFVLSDGKNICPNPKDFKYKIQIKERQIR